MTPLAASWLALSFCPSLVSAWILFLFPRSPTAFLVAASLDALVGLGGLYFLLKHPVLIRFANVLGISLLLGYALGTAISAVAGLIATGQFDPTVNPSYLSYRQADISHALMLVACASTLLFMVGVIDRPLFPTPPEPQDLTSPRARIVLLLGAALVVGAFAAGDLGYMGTRLSATRNITPLGSLSALLAPALPPLTVLCLRRERSRVWRAILLVLLGASALALLPLGRRVLLYSLLCALFAFVVSGRGAPSRPWRRWAWVGIGAPLLLAFMLAGFYFFFALRVAGYSLGPESSLSERVGYAARLLRHGRAMVGPQFVENIGSRPFILAYLAGLYAAQADHPPLWGREIAFAFQTAVPSVLFPEKTALLPAAPEELVHPALGIPVFDGNTTIVTAGLDDFGAAGALVYPLALVLLYGIVRRLAVGRLPPVVYYLVIFRMLYQLLYVEQSLSGMVTTVIRDLALVTLLLLVVWKLSGVRRVRA